MFWPPDVLFSVNGTAALSLAFVCLTGSPEQPEVFPSATKAPYQQEARPVFASRPAQWCAPKSPRDLRDRL